MARLDSSLPIRVSSFIATVIVGIGLGACQPVAQAVTQPEKPRPVRVQTAVFESKPTTRTYAGVVKARIETKLGFRLEGKVLSRSANVGDIVKAGQEVARLDDRDFELRLASARSEFDAARSALAQAQAELDRIATLEKKGWATNASSDRQIAITDEAKSRVMRGQHAVDLALNQLSYVSLKAEADSVVTSTSVEAGQVVKVGDPIVGMAQLGEKEAVVSIPESAIADLRKQSVTVELWSEPGRQRRATLRELSPLADPATRTYTARFAIEDADESVALGMTAIVALTQQTGPAVVRLPLSAIYDNGSGPAVWVAENGSLLNKPVEIAGIGAQDVFVRSGLAEGDKVVTLGVHKLDPQQRVRIVATNN
ncbi:MAG TPA: efflux RND transporter periplasmic adaptor subunit [Hyphomicrobium sp.]|nr:efflux RND transporter periplasmic adaptor subunit [Hyphomicrobium sp.]